jgi:hypothetical protein
MGLKVIITGATGMVGEGVLNECIQHPSIESILVITRKKLEISHPKIKSLVHPDFFDLSTVTETLKGYDACLFCLGVSSVGMNEKDYSRLTYDLTIYFAGVISSVNRGMTFCYISGAGTDSSEQGRIMWARVKGRTENALMKMAFRKVYLFRPGYLQPTPGLSNTLKFYKYISWLYPFMKQVTPGYVSTLKELGLAMIYCALFGYDKNILEVKDIKIAANANKKAAI